MEEKQKPREKLGPGFEALRKLDAKGLTDPKAMPLSPEEQRQKEWLDHLIRIQNARKAALSDGWDEFGGWAG